ncbi:MAG: sugar ABC transporter substrate-binding protein [Pseudomonadota bacterium]|nr:sugar ABC transporter substrate-binding protein [Pseudomonadota bacterium]
MAYFDDRFLTNLREAMDATADELGVNIQFEDAQGDIGRQLSQMQNFIAQGVDVMIINPVDTASTPQMTKLATQAGIPLVYVNRKPQEETLPEGVYYVGSDENVSGKLQGEEIARQLNNKGKVAIMMGELGDAATRLRTEGVEKVAAQHPEIEIVERQPAKFQRTEAVNLMNNWLVSGVQMDAIAANNDEMAIGAIMSLQQAGKDPKPYIIAGIDATADALVEMKRGNLDITVFQDAKGQGKGAVETAVKVTKGEKVEPFVWVPFELVTQDNYEQYLNR